MTCKVFLNPESGFIERSYADNLTNQDDPEATDLTLPYARQGASNKSLVEITDVKIMIGLVDLFNTPSTMLSLAIRIKSATMV